MANVKMDTGQLIQYRYRCRGWLTELTGSVSVVHSKIPSEHDIEKQKEYIRSSIESARGSDRCVVHVGAVIQVRLDGQSL